MERVMGLDVGSRTVGVALTDELGITTQGLETIWRKEENKLRQTLARIEAIIEEKHVGQIICGLPLHMDQSFGERAEKTVEFGEKLHKRTGLPLLFVDERLTTVEAAQILRDSGVPVREHKKHIDQIAAAFILESYLKEPDKALSLAGAKARMKAARKRNAYDGENHLPG